MTSRAQVPRDPAATNRSAVPSVQLSQRRERRGRRSPGRRLPPRKDGALEMSVWRSLADGVLPEKGSFTATSILFYNPRVHHSPESRAGTYQRFGSRHAENVLAPRIWFYSPPWPLGTRGAERAPRPARSGPRQRLRAAPGQKRLCRNWPTEHRNKPKNISAILSLLIK